ncbi:GerMN domain-containing protein [Deinococcus sp. KNUC1210]|uniref:GerMN domain-containing protein n=1 Tax=Deinococcus sp. KNUC1210 TaxID=2917691 RepID=UPI001EEFD20B|nr:GerMN domain-containing protein [Deinococcus sp. KNUC1210]ULH15940.1 GerMN domain-containing protein [Deinococcus sp. KNUC1210]
MRPLFSMFNAVSLVLLSLCALAYKVVQLPPSTPQPPKLTVGATSGVSVVLYFSDTQVRNFVRQTRTVQVAQNVPGAVAQASVKAWAAGPTGSGAVAVVPSGSAVPRVWLRGDHFLVNLPASYADLNYGASGERMLLCSLVRTLLERRGKDVMFLVNTQNVPTLLGHADLSAPYAREDCADE